ncbi:MAG: isoprenyl transferase [Saprospiraceae bacterium]|nr:isoprenyl transferase [Candidatus Vicinibacter affinis]MBP6523204.1 isoprenyl transferase [Saprospiraceae bacterium]MBK6573336.1 isoprenyl transferase [Candidatus Vicinibacter affinis]MBK6822194.1 isoprenyl transferase [Candidatus Vicinibacter affinis]MBK7302018.1 isoprenyl transferase [Candidatus Vicinibacter affinis]
MPDIISHLDLQKIPQHIAIIMDGNGRWAKKNGQPRLYGHKAGVTSVKEITEACAELGVKHLTLYAFSTENWNRPILEVSGLMNLLVETVKLELRTLLKNDIRLNAIGDLNGMPEKTRNALLSGIQETSSNKRMQLNLALNYSSRWEILQAAQKIASDARSGLLDHELNEDYFSNLLTTRNIPDPDLLIRTSGEQRISNFLLWQLAYTELYFTEVLWPDFRKKELYKAILDYQSRERRFGMISEQLI